MKGTELIEFYLPVEYTTIYDKVTIDPMLAYGYSLSPDRKALTLDILEHVAPNEHYTVTVDPELAALRGKGLLDGYRFSFNTVTSTYAFLIERAVMVEGGGYPPGIDLDTGWLERTQGIERGMELLVFFNAEFYLQEVEGALLVEPGVPFHLVKEGTSLRFIFEDAMGPEEIYRVTFGVSMTNIHGVSLDRVYAFEWVVDGAGSQFCRALTIHAVNPDVPEIDTLIYDNGTPYHNETMPVSPKIGHSEVEFRIAFSSSIDVYRSLDRVQLIFLHGNPGARSGELLGYVWNHDEKTLNTTFSLPALVDGGDGYYKLILTGGEEGIVDSPGNPPGNPMEDSIGVYVVYDIPE